MSGSTHDELAEFHAALARLTPTPDGINLAQLMYQAGRLSAARRNGVWRIATAASMMLSLGLGSMLWLRPLPQPTERIVQVFVQPPAPPPEPTPPTNDEPTPALSEPDLPTDARQAGGETDYLRLRRQVLAHGLDTLPPPTPWPAAAPPVDTNTLLDLPKDSREPWIRFLKHSLQSGDPL